MQWRQNPSPFLPPLAQVHRHVLRLEVLLDSLLAALAAEAGLLHAAERRGGVRDEALVEADHAGLQPLAYADRALEVARVDVGHQAVLRVVRGVDRVLLGLE